MRQRLEGLEQKAARLSEESARLRGELAEAEEAEAGLAAAFAVAEERHLAAVEAALQAEEARRSADAERHTWVARADALAQALDDARTRAGSARLSQVEGVIGTLLDLVEIDDGFESAFEAAAGEALAAVVVDDVEAGRRALEVLHAGDLSARCCRSVPVVRRHRCRSAPVSRCAGTCARLATTSTACSTRCSAQ